MERSPETPNENQLSRYKYYVATWNAAIEAAMEKFKTQFVASEVIIEMLKELKK